MTSERIAHIAGEMLEDENVCEKYKEVAASALGQTLPDYNIRRAAERRFKATAVKPLG